MTEMKTIQVQALKKLTHRESNLLLGPLLSLADPDKSTSSSQKKKPGLSDVLARYHEMLAQIGRELMFEDAEGNKMTAGEWHDYVYDQLMN